MTNISIGKNGEEIARKYLEKHGFKIIETNKRFSKTCEIDIVAEEKRTLVFVEVKTRKTNICGSPLGAITKEKYKHMKQGAFLYLQENKGYKKFRIDAISIILRPELKIEHLKNVSLW